MTIDRFGEDVSTFVMGQLVPGVSPQFSTIAGSRTVAENIARRLITERGTLPWDRAAGFNVRGYLNETITQRASSKIRSGVFQQVMLEERVRAVRVAVTASGSLDSQTISIALVMTLAEGPFRLTVAISALTVELLS